MFGIALRREKAPSRQTEGQLGLGIGNHTKARSFRERSHPHSIPLGSWL